MQPIRIYLFRQFCIEHEAVEMETQKVRELFCYLLLHRKRPHTRDQLATLLWGNSPTTQARKYLRQTLWQLQSALNHGNAISNHLITCDRDWISANITPEIYLDVDEFETAYALVKGIDGRELDGAKVAKLQKAVKLYQGDLLENWYQDWCIFERERLQNIYLAMLDKLIRYHESVGAYEMGMFYGMQILEYDRSHERTYRRLMRLHYLAGDRTGALRQFKRCVQVLNDELDVEPSRRTIMLYQQIQSDQLQPPNIILDNQTKPGHSLPEILENLLELKQTLVFTQRQLDEALDIVVAAISERPNSQISSP